MVLWCLVTLSSVQEPKFEFLIWGQKAPAQLYRPYLDLGNDWTWKFLIGWTWLFETWSCFPTLSFNSLVAMVHGYKYSDIHANYCLTRKRRTYTQRCQKKERYTHSGHHPLQSITQHTYWNYYQASGILQFKKPKVLRAGISTHSNLARC